MAGKETVIRQRQMRIAGAPNQKSVGLIKLEYAAQIWTGEHP
jgi:hypothetical protein